MRSGGPKRVGADQVNSEGGSAGENRVYINPDPQKPGVLEIAWGRKLHQLWGEG